MNSWENFESGKANITWQTQTSLKCVKQSWEQVKKRPKKLCLLEDGHERGKKWRRATR